MKKSLSYNRKFYFRFILVFYFFLLPVGAQSPISILELVKSGTPEEVQKAIQAGADVNLRSPAQFLIRH